MTERRTDKEAAERLEWWLLYFNDETEGKRHPDFADNPYGFDETAIEADLRIAAQRLREMPEGERIEGCEIGSAFIRDNFGGDSVTVKLPPDGSLHKMLLEPCTLTIHERKEPNNG